MAYIKQNFADGDTLYAAGLNAMDNQIAKNESDIGGRYAKPSSGIPKGDLDSGVQSSLEKADSALQEHQSLAAYRTASAQDAIDAQKVGTSTTVNGHPLSGNVTVTASDVGAATTDAIAATDRRVDALYKLTQGQVWDAEEDRTEAYSKAVPSGAKAVAVTKIGGKTVVWNQYCNHDKTMDAIGGTVERQDDGSVVIHIDGTLNYAGVYEIRSTSDSFAVKGHRYLLSTIVKPSFDSDYFDICIHIGTYQVGSSYSSVTKNVENRISAIVEYKLSNPDSTQTMQFQVWCPHSGASSYSGETCEIRDWYMVDLTQMFGSTVADTITTPEQAYALGCPREYIPYNTGELVSAKVESVDSAGFNIWDEEWEIGSYNVSNGNKYNSQLTRIRSKNYISVLPNTTYGFRNTASSSSSESHIMCFYKKDKGFISGAWQPFTYAFTTPNDCYYITFAQSDAYGTVYLNNICIHLKGSGEYDGTYKPYHAPVSMEIPSSVLALDGYGWSAGTAHNSIEYDEDSGKWWYHKRVGSINLSGLTWYYSPNNSIFIATAGTPAIVDETNQRLVLVNCDKLTPVSWVNRATDLSVCMVFGSAYFGVKNHAYGSEDVSAFKSWIDELNATLTYLLATETVTDITDLMTGVDNFLQTETGGTLTFKQQSDTTIAVPNMETYFVQLSEV